MVIGVRQVWLGVILAGTLSGTMACTGPSSAGPDPKLLAASDGLVKWRAGDTALKDGLRAAYDQYRREDSLEALQGYEAAVRKYLDHGFTLYRTLKEAKRDLPTDLLPSLEQRTAQLMDVADEYIRHGSLAMGEGIAEEVIHDYSDLQAMGPAQRRAEAVLMRYRYRQDY